MTRANIPKVAAPMDFGIEFLASPSHGNLKFLFLEEEELLANSAIMSFNSPVIKKMTIEDGRTTVDVHEFSRDAVQFFLKASYTGSLETLSPELFRDVNKIAHVFEVTWLVARCFEYFKWMVELEIVHETDFTSQLYVFDEAMFILDQLKNKNYLDLVVKKFTSQPSLIESFVTSYLKDISQCSGKIMDVILELTNNQEHILVKALLNNLKIDNSALHANSRRILERLDFTNYSSAYHSQFNELLEMLEDIENPSKEDYRLIMRILREHAKKSVKKKHPQCQVAVPNLFLKFDPEPFKNLNNLDEITKYLIASPLVNSSLLFCDALETWLMAVDKNTRGPHFESIEKTDSDCDRFIKIFEEHMLSKKWTPIPKCYIEDSTPRKICLSNLVNKICESPSLTTVVGYDCETSISEYTPEEFFSVDHDIKFMLTTLGCKTLGNCGIILRVKAATGNYDDSFDMKFVTDQNYYGEDIHFHKNSIDLDKVHFALEITMEDGERISDVQVSFGNKPLRDRTGNFWCWGPCLFVNEGEGQPLAEDHFPINEGFIYGRNARIRPIIYFPYHMRFL